MSLRAKIAAIVMLLALAVSLAPAATADTGASVPQNVSVSAAKPAWDAETGEPLAAWTCSTGNVCFWTGFDGTGSRCMWDVADPNWATGAYVCSWARTTNVKSVWNRGTNSSLTGVAYYLRPNYSDRIGCTPQGARGNLRGTYMLWSHRWINTSCG
jgi:hypothetical protein